MIDLTSAGNRAVELLDSMGEFQNTIHSTPLDGELKQFLVSMKLAGQNLQAVNEYMQSKETDNLPLPVWKPVIQNEPIRFRLPSDSLHRGTLSDTPMSVSDSRIFQSSFSSVTPFVFPTVNSSSNFL